jgi:hypothetical protein
MKKEYKNYYEFLSYTVSETQQEFILKCLYHGEFIYLNKNKGSFNKNPPKCPGCLNIKILSKPVY